MFASSLSSSLLVLGLSMTPPSAATAAACVPECRSGYVCIEGTCVSACNPVCANGERCTAERSCEPAAKPASAVPAVAVREPAAAPAAAPEPPAKPRAKRGFRHWEMGAAVGLNFGNTLSIDPDRGADVDHGTGSSPAVLVFAETVPTRGLSVGGLLYMTKLDGDFGDADLLGLGATLKARMNARPNLQLRPGVLLSFQKTDVDGLGAPVQGLGVGVLVDVASALNESFGIVTTIGFVAQPAGGNGDADLTFGPTVFWTGGIEFGS